MEQGGDIGIIEEGLTCFGCSYDLRGRGADGACPECGMAVAESVREGGWDRAEAGWRRRVVRGAGWSAGEYLVLLVGIGVGTVLSLLAQSSPSPWVGRAQVCLEVGLFAAMGLCAAAGGWWVTAPEPGGSGRVVTGWRRRCVRALSAAAGVAYAAVVAAAMSESVRTGQGGQNWYLAVCTVMAGVNGARGVLLIQYLRGLVRRVPGRRAGAAVGVLAWAPGAGWWGVAGSWFVTYWPQTAALIPLILAGVLGALAVAGGYEWVLWWRLRGRRRPAGEGR